MSENPETSIIIVNYRSSEPLRRCLTSLRGLVNDSVEKIVYDNGGEDEGIRSLGASDVRLLDSQTNYGFGGACNRAARSARGEFLLFLNPDTSLRRGSIGSIVKEMRSDPSIGILGPSLVLSDGSVQPWSFGRSVTPFTTMRNNAFPWLKRHGTVETRDVFVDWVSGAALFIRKNLFDRIGGFDERFFMYFEDVDLCRRVKAGGMTIFRSGSLEFEHSGGSSFEKSNHLQKRYYYASQDAYFEKHFGVIQSRAIRFFRRAFT